MRRRQRDDRGDASGATSDGALREPDFTAVLTGELGRVDREHTKRAEPEQDEASTVAARSVIDLAVGRAPQPAVVDFWNRYDEARALADLLDVPPATAVAVVAPLELAIPVVHRCIAEHPVGDCEVFVLTELAALPDEPGWTLLDRAPDLVAALEEATTGAPILVLDVPRELPAALRPLIDRLRRGGLSMVRHVTDVPPDDEDLATWHGELGRPSVLDLATPIEPARIVELLERGEPIASVDGATVAAELILALQMELLG